MRIATKPTPGYEDLAIVANLGRVAEELRTACANYPYYRDRAAARGNFRARLRQYMAAIEAAISDLALAQAGPLSSATLHEASTKETRT